MRPRRVVDAVRAAVAGGRDRVARYTRIARSHCGLPETYAPARRSAEQVWSRLVKMALSLAMMALSAG